MEEEKDKIIQEESKQQKPKKKNIFDRLRPEKSRELDEEAKKKIEKKSRVIAWLVFVVALTICSFLFSKYTVIAFEFSKNEVSSFKMADTFERILSIPKYILIIIGIIFVCSLIISIISDFVDKLLKYKYMYDSIKKVCIVCILDTIEGILLLGLFILAIYGIIKFMSWFVTTKVFSVLIKIILGIIVVVGIYLLLFKYEVVHYKPGVHSFTYLDEDFRCPVWVEVLIYTVVFLIFIFAIYKFTTS